MGSSAFQSGFAAFSPDRVEKNNAADATGKCNRHESSGHRRFYAVAVAFGSLRVGAADVSRLFPMRRRPPNPPMLSPPANERKSICPLLAKDVKLWTIS